MSARIALFLLLSACGTPSSPPAATEAPAAEPTAAEPAAAPTLDKAAALRVKAAMKQLGTTLKGTLTATMSESGPVAAMEVCSQHAGSLTDGVTNATGVTVGRSSLRLRNPDNVGPEWVSAWLTAQGERPAEGVQPSVTAAVREDGVPVVRGIGPIPVEAPCLVCHGPTDTRSPAIQAALAERYPSDAAGGYAIGDLRGAIWAEVPVVDAGLTLHRNGDEPWPLDESTRTGMQRVRTAAMTGPPGGPEAAKRMAESIRTALSELIQECSMDGEAHDALHTFLEAFFPTLDSLEAAGDAEQAAAARERMLAQLALFNATFE